MLTASQAVSLQPTFYTAQMRGTDHILNFSIDHKMLKFKM